MGSTRRGIAGWRLTPMDREPIGTGRSRPSVVWRARSMRRLSLDRNSAGAEDGVDPGRFIRLGPLDSVVEIGDRQGTGTAGDGEILLQWRSRRCRQSPTPPPSEARSWRADSTALIWFTPSSTEL